MIKRAPSMDIQLATILTMNSSNLSINELGLNQQKQHQQIKTNPYI